ncbi:hypothetical protein AYL99_00452 [Fonsecaea erecta]|uniref:Uncharacterized protein n=1 Tax=Fonsecaea erecta TaxID=1367422 RepID=A0A178ZXC1_9EURO|nr:hypothetical protein AYL99_00452 [Fonsecaea erecta]OAP64480.1 hypothetical protein AYL99_00452 [Fonsecaea erecta]
MKLQDLLWLGIVLFPAPLAAAETSEILAIMRGLPRDESGKGFIHLGDDGVLRSFDGDLKVVAYQPLTPDQITAYIDRTNEERRPHLREVFEGVDGRDVVDEEQLTNPAPGLLPAFKPGSLPEVEKPTRRNERRHSASGGDLGKRVPCNQILCTNDIQCQDSFCFGCEVADFAWLGACF